MKSSGWVIVIFEKPDTEEFSGEVVYVKGPFDTYEAALDWAEEDCDDGRWQITFIEPRDEAKQAA